MDLLKPTTISATQPAADERMPEEEKKLRSDFENWMGKYKKVYESDVEKEARFKNFKTNLLGQPPSIPASGPLWEVLGPYADEAMTKNFHHLRLDHYEMDSDSDDGRDRPPGVSTYMVVPIKKEDGTIGEKIFTIAEGLKYLREQLKDETNDKDQDPTLIKHQTTVLPGKRTSDDKDDTKDKGPDKRQKIGCGDQKQGCCSDCGK